jgi:putative endonuclease
MSRTAPPASGLKVKAAIAAASETVPASGPAAVPRCFVYILGSRRGADCRTYVGWTLDLDRRLLQHNSGAGAKSTRGRDWRLLYAECCATRGEAMSREFHLKRARKLRQELRAALLDETAG